MTEAEKRRLREQGINPDTAANPFAGSPVGLATLPRTPAVAPVAASVDRLAGRTTVAPRVAPVTPTVPPAATDYPEPGSLSPDAYESAIAPLVQEKVRKSSGVSAADFYGRGLGVTRGNPFETGFFKNRPAPAAPAAPTPLATLPRTPQAPVGGTVAVVDRDTGVNGNTRTNAVRTPYGSGFTTTAPIAPGTRQPFIAGADGQNVAADYVAGGKFSSAKAGSDRSLDQNYVRGLPRKRKQEALLASG